MELLNLLSIEKLRAQAFKNELPELYELNEVIEDSKEWHTHDSVFNHTIEVLSHLQKLIAGASPSLKKYLKVKVGRLTKGELLQYGALFHDIAKKETMVIKEGFTACPGHEQAGAEKAEKILKRLGFEHEERSYITTIIADHDLVSGSFGFPEEEEDQRMEKLRQTSASFPELVLFTLSDMLGSHLKSTNPAKFTYRCKYLTHCINAF